MKIGPGVIDSLCKQVNRISNHEVDSDDDFDNYEPAEASCEPAVVEGQLCNLPYELYDLPNLREILSVETWNLCLTEEERISLTAYLPDMDEQTFWLTMNELLGGNDMHFGNPVDIFFKRLKGGFYPPKVVALRECLQFMQRRKYYHSLRSYHDNMVQMLNDMKRLWNPCGMDIGVKERIQMWRTRRTCRRNNLLDLNTVPEDGELLGEESKSDIVGHQVAKQKKFVTPKCSAKGVLKVKASGNYSFLNHNGKGVLKVLPKVPTFPQSTPLGIGRGVLDQNVNPLPVPLFFRNSGCVDEPSLPWPKVGASEVRMLLEEPQCTLNQQGTVLRTSRYSDSSNLKRKTMNSSLDNISGLGKHRLFRSNVGGSPSAEYESFTDVGVKRHSADGKDSWHNCGMVNKGTSMNLLRPFPFKLQGAEQKMRPMPEEHTINHPRPLDMVPRISDASFSKQEIKMTSTSDQMKDSENRYGKLNVSERFKDANVFPLTYKRRKAQVKNKSLEFGKPLSAGADSNFAFTE